MLEQGGHVDPPCGDVTEMYQYTREGRGRLVRVSVCLRPLTEPKAESTPNHQVPSPKPLAWELGDGNWALTPFSVPTARKPGWHPGPPAPARRVRAAAAHSPGLAQASGLR